MKKEKKITINFYLRKLAHPKNIKFWGYQEEVEGQPIYIEVIHQRKNNSTISQFLKFSELQSTKSNFQNLNLSESLIPEDFFNSFIKQYELSSLKDLNFNSNPFYKLISEEYLHIYHMIRYASDRIESEKFTLSRFSDAYNFSLINVPDIFRQIMKLEITKYFYQINPDFPQILNQELAFSDLYNGISKLLKSNLLFDFHLNNLVYVDIDKFIDNLHPDDGISEINGFTLPIWISNNYTEKLRKLVFENKRSNLKIDINEIYFQRYLGLFNDVDNVVSKLSKDMVKYFE